MPTNAKKLVSHLGYGHANKRTGELELSDHECAELLYLLTDEWLEDDDDEVTNGDTT